MKYIPSDKLIAKIVELRKELPDTIEHLNDEESGFARGQQYELTAIEAEILCLQQEQLEVDIEKEAIKFVQSKEFIESEESPVLLIARHFAKWGAEHARKEE